MPEREVVDAFIRDVLSNDHVSAAQRWYHPDAQIEENQGEPRGAEALIEGERRLQSSTKSIRSELLEPPIVDGDRVAIRWRFTMDFLDGTRMILTEVAWQVWRGDRIWRETFFYDPAQKCRKAI